MLNPIYFHYSQTTALLNREENKIRIENNGEGIPIEMHKKEKMYIPTLIFGHLLTSSNFNDDEKKVTGGRNGFGAKLCNIFSKKFIVETTSSKMKRSFKQVRQLLLSKEANHNFLFLRFGKKT